eukprot:6182911-Pleurochrysis_carterae.AAC.2
MLADASKASARPWFTTGQSKTHHEPSRQLEQALSPCSSPYVLLTSALDRTYPDRCTKDTRCSARPNAQRQRTRWKRGRGRMDEEREGAAALCSGARVAAPASRGRRRSCPLWCSKASRRPCRAGCPPHLN